MTKADLNDVMLWSTTPGDDITMAGCSKEYFPESQHDIFSSASRRAVYVFENVTIPSSKYCEDLTGNGYLAEVFSSYEGAMQMVTKTPDNNEQGISINFCNGDYFDTTWTNNCFGAVENESGKYEGYFQDGLPHGQGTLSFENHKIIGTFNNGDISRGRIEALDGSYYYEGELEDGVPHGQGSYVSIDNFEYSGQFENGEFNGYGRLTDNKGEIVEGIFRDDQYIGPIEGKPSESKFVDDGLGADELFQVGSGSGFVISNSGHIITNNHVIEGCSEVEIRNEGAMLTARVLAFDPLNDLAILKAEFTPKNSLSISNTNPELLEDIYVAGFPFGDNVSTSLKVTRGIVSSLTGLGNNFSNMQIDAALQPGNSGGPIVNKNGLVVGVAVAKLDALSVLEESGSIPENTNFGIKSNVVLNFIEANRINVSGESISTESSADLGRLLTDSTYYLSCNMTSNQYELMKSHKFMFDSL